MSKTTKIIIAIVLLSIVGCGASVAVFATFGYKFTQNIKQQAPIANKEAEQFGQTHTQAQCLPEALKRHKAALGQIMKQTQVSIFYNRCIGVAKKTPDFCKGTPGQSGEIMKTIKASQTYAEKQCASYKDAEKIACKQYVQMIPTYCQNQRIKKSDTPKK